MSSNNVQKIKDRLNIVDVVGAYLKLQKAGINLKTCCPFHNEKTPSFFVSPDRGTFKCFGCGAGGDMFTFVEQFEGIDFPGALKILAEKAGVELVREDPKKVDERKRLYSIMEEATLYFEGRLDESKDAKEYLQGRGLQEDTVKKFRVGYVEDDWRRLYEFLKAKGYKEEEIEKVGLIKKSENSKDFYDRFRNRIIFPLFDNSGRVIAFSGRLFKDDEKSAKYLNSPETVLFNKSRVLYGYNFAKNDIRKRDFSLLVEGQMDIIMSHQAGFTNTVATSGTALTGEHLLLLKRLSDKVMMAFDGDAAGLMAANKGAKLALGEGMEVKLVEIPDDSDPADMILKDKDGWIKSIKNSVHIIEFNLNTLIKKEQDERKLGLEIKKIVLPLVSRLTSRIEQDHFISQISLKTNIDKDILWEDLKNTDVEVESKFIQNNVQKVSTNGEVKKKKILRDITGIIHWQKTLGEPSLNINEAETKLFNLVGKEVFKKIKNLPEEVVNEIIFEAENLYSSNGTVKEKIDELFENLEKSILIEKRELLLQKVKEGKNESESLKEIDKISKEIEKL